MPKEVKILRSIQSKMAFGALWMLLMTLVERTLGLISTLILARLLDPTDFGTVGLAGSFILMVQMFSAFGFDVALIQNQGAAESHYHTAWTFNLILGLLILLLMLAVAEPIAKFYNHPEIFWVICLLALGPLISGCENIGVVAFRKDLDFRKEFAFQISRKLIGFAVTIPLAFWLCNYWALVAGMLAARLAGTITSYLAHPFRPHLSLGHASNILGFSKWLLVNNWVCFLKERSCDFIIGRLLGVAPLGLYNISYEVANMPTTELSAPINRALLPGFARIAHDAGKMRTAYINAISMLMLLAVPAAAGIFAVAPFLVPVMLGPKWLASVPLLEVLAFNGGLQLFHSSICTVLVANGHPDRVTKINSLYVVILLVFFGIIIPTYGLIGAAFAVTGVSILTTPVYLYQVKRSLGVSFWEFLRVTVRPLAAAVFMVGLVRWILPEWIPDMNFAASMGWLLEGVALGISSYTSIVLLLWLGMGRPAGAERELFDRFRQQLLKKSDSHRHLPET